MTDAASALDRPGGWRATHLFGASIIEGTTITLRLDADGRVSGSAGTNSYAASFRETGAGTIWISEPAATRRYLDIPSGRMAQEQTFLAALGSVDRVTMEGDERVLWAGEAPAIRLAPAR